MMQYSMMPTTWHWILVQLIEDATLLSRLVERPVLKNNFAFGSAIVTKLLMYEAPKKWIHNTSLNFITVVREHSRSFSILFMLVFNFHSTDSSSIT